MSLDQALEPDVGDDLQAQTRSKAPAQEGEAKEPPTTEDSAVQGDRRKGQLLVCLPKSHLY